MNVPSALALALHIIGIFVWVGGLYAIIDLLRVRDAQRDAATRDALGAAAKIAGRKADAGALLTIVGGVWLLSRDMAGYMRQPWMHIKLTLVVVGALGVHGFLRAKSARAGRGAEATLPSVAAALVTAVFAAIVVTVVFKPMAR